MAWLAAGGCVGGQSGDDGLSNDGPSTPWETTFAAAEACFGDPAVADAGDSGEVPSEHSCTEAGDGGTGFDCNCAGERGHSEASSCEDALRERCGVEPRPEPDAAADAWLPAGEDLPPPSEP